MARITLENVAKDYPRQDQARSGLRRSEPRAHALDGISLEIANGEFLTVLGPSGSGKTTLLRLIAGLDSVTTGRIAMDGRDVTASAPEARDVAMVFQRDALLPHLSARENIELGLRLRGFRRSEIAQRMGEMVELLQLGDVVDRRPAALSGGERQRTAVARALVRRPRAFLLDEPFSSLDASLRASLRRTLVDLHRRLGTTVVHVTHDQAEAMALGDRIAVLCHGKLQQVAEPAVLCRQPANVFVAGFVGTPPMNLWRGVLAHQGGSLWFHPNSGTDQLALCLTETQHAPLTDRVGKGIVIGLRAEDIAETGKGRPMPYGTEVRAVVIAVECLGSDALVRWDCGGAEFVTLQPLHAVPVVQTSCSLVFDMARAHFFDGVTELALSHLRPAMVD